MVENIFRRIREENSNINMDFAAEIYNEALIMIEDLRLKIANKLLIELGLPSPNQSAVQFDVELRHEQNYNSGDPLSSEQTNVHKITFKQKYIYDQIMETVNNRVGEIFLDAPRGTGKSCKYCSFRFVIAIEHEIH